MVVQGQTRQLVDVKSRQESPKGGRVNAKLHRGTDMKRILVSMALVASIVAVPVQGMAQGGGGKCDFDGDGYDDVPVGVPFEDVDVIGSAGAGQRHIRVG